MTTVRKIIHADEWYPVFELHDSPLGRSVDFPEELLEEYTRIMEEFEAMQEVLSKLHDEGTSVTPRVVKW